MLTFWLLITILTIGTISMVLYPCYQATFSKNIKTVVVLLVFFPLLSLSLYLHWGNSTKLSAWLAVKDRSQEVRAQIEKFGSRQKIITTLESRLQTLPADKKTARGWSILAKLYISNNEFSKALMALQKANAFDQDNTEFLMQLVMLKFYLNKNHLDAETKTLLLRVIKIEPKQPEAINLLALDNYEHKNYSTAIRYWESLLPLFNPESQDSKNLLMMIRQAQLAHTAQTIYVDVKVNLSGFDTKKLTHKFVFIYALPENGSKVPLAVIRKSITDLPCTVRLDDTRSMLGDHLLSQAKHVVIFARASKSGAAMTQNGDLIGKSKILDPTKDHQTQITIRPLSRKAGEG